MPVVSSCSSARAMKRREFIMLLGGVESRIRLTPHAARNAGPLIRTSRSGRRRRHRDGDGLTMSPLALPTMANNSTFVTSTDGHGGTNVVDPSATEISQASLLAQPHQGLAALVMLLRFHGLGAD